MARPPEGPAAATHHSPNTARHSAPTRASGSLNKRAPQHPTKRQCRCLPVKLSLERPLRDRTGDMLTLHWPLRAGVLAGGGCPMGCGVTLGRAPQFPALSLRGGQPLSQGCSWGSDTIWSLSQLTERRSQAVVCRTCLMATSVLTWLHGAHDSTAAPQHRLVDGLLVCGELAIGREGARDVGGEAVILSTHVEQAAGRGGCEVGMAPPPSPRRLKDSLLGPGGVRVLSPSHPVASLVRAAVWGLPPCCVLTLPSRETSDPEQGSLEGVGPILCTFPCPPRPLLARHLDAQLQGLTWRMREGQRCLQALTHHVASTRALPDPPTTSLPQHCSGALGWMNPPDRQGGLSHTTQLSWAPRSE